MDNGFCSSSPDDNAFYAELTRQMLLLMDEDDEVHTTSEAARRFNRTSAHVGWSLMPGNYFSWSGSGEVSVPGWMERLWMVKGGGTGVFIPRSGVHRSKKRHNKPRKNNDRGAHPAAGHKILGSKD